MRWRLTHDKMNVVGKLKHFEHFCLIFIFNYNLLFQLCKIPDLGYIHSISIAYNYNDICMTKWMWSANQSTSNIFVLFSFFNYNLLFQLCKIPDLGYIHSISIAYNYNDICMTKWMWSANQSTSNIFVLFSFFNYNLLFQLCKIPDLGYIHSISTAHNYNDIVYGWINFYQQKRSSHFRKSFWLCRV